MNLHVYTDLYCLYKLNMQSYMNFQLLEFGLYHFTFQLSILESKAPNSSNSWCWFCCREYLFSTGHWFMTSLSLRTAILSGFGALAERATTNPMRRRRGGHFALHGLLGPLKSLLATIVWFAGKFLGKSSLPLPCEVFFAHRQRQNQSVKVSNRELTYLHVLFYFHFHRCSDPYSDRYSDQYSDRYSDRYGNQPWGLTKTTMTFWFYDND